MILKILLLIGLAIAVFLSSFRTESQKCPFCGKRGGVVVPGLRGEVSHVECRHCGKMIG